MNSNTTWLYFKRNPPDVSWRRQPIRRRIRTVSRMPCRRPPPVYSVWRTDILRIFALIACFAAKLVSAGLADTRIAWSPLGLLPGNQKPGGGLWAYCVLWINRWIKWWIDGWMDGRIDGWSFVSLRTKEAIRLWIYTGTGDVAFVTADVKVEKQEERRNKDRRLKEEREDRLLRWIVRTVPKHAGKTE